MAMPSPTSAVPKVIELTMRIWVQQSIWWSTSGLSGAQAAGHRRSGALRPQTHRRGLHLHRHRHQQDQIITATVEPANEEEIQSTITVMGGQDWELWMAALRDAGVLADGAKSVAYSYIGTDLTWPIYWHGTLGRAKEDLDRAATAIRGDLAAKGDRPRGRAQIRGDPGLPLPFP